MINKYLLLGLSLCGSQCFAGGLSYDFESNSDDWSPRGEGPTIELTSDYAHGGKNALFVDNREQSWHGALVENEYIQPGKTYIFSVWVMALDNVTMDLSLQYSSEDGSTSYPGICNAQSYAYSWTKLSGEIVIPEGAENIQPYVQCSSDATKAFYIDDFTCEEKLEEVIDFSQQPSLKDIYKDYFKIGTAVTAGEITPSNAKALVKRHFNSVTPGNELKPDNMLDQAASIEVGNNVNPQVHLAASTKTVLKFCSDNKIPIRGHVFVWHSQTPDWFFNENFENDGNLVSKEIMDQRMENYIRNVIDIVTTAYPDLEIYAWDIVNEAFQNDQGVMREPGSNYSQDGHSKWMEVYGDDSFIYNAFTYARKYLPKGCKAYYNDYNEYCGTKLEGIYDLVKSLYDKGLCDGVGMQSHLSLDFPWIELYKAALDKFVSIGCDIQITELDITIEGDKYDEQAKKYKDLFDLYREYKDHISLVAVWGINDETSWRTEGKPLLFSNYQPKDAFNAIIEGLPVPTGVEAAKANANVSIVPTTIERTATVNCEGQFGYRFVNLAGQEMLKGVGNNQVLVDATELPADVYVVEVKAANGVKKNVKVVKK